jgi:phenylpropionate dioxygenase-like ring-hydroxylating dioxygenase large terminal subunit
MTIDASRWYPVAGSEDLPPGHVYQTRLGGHPLAIWRAASGTVNIWEDRCPHRGVRFSIGYAAGEELRCQYHAWRFASGSGACTFIPAQPEAKPAAAIRARTWPVMEHGGLVWTGLSPEGEPATPGDGAVLRAIPVNRDAAEVEPALETIGGATFFIHPIDAKRCVIRGLATPDRLGAIDAALERLRLTLESA